MIFYREISPKMPTISLTYCQKTNKSLNKLSLAFTCITVVTQAMFLDPMPHFHDLYNIFYQAMLNHKFCV